MESCEKYCWFLRKQPGGMHCGYFILRAAEFTELPAIFFKVRISPFCFFLCIKTAWNVKLATEAQAHQLYVFALLLLFLHIRDDSQSVPWNNPFIQVMYIPKQQHSNELWICESRSTTKNWLNNLLRWKCHIHWQRSDFSGINEIKRFGLQIWCAKVRKTDFSDISVSAH